VETRWKLTRRSLTSAACWLVLAVVCILAPFDELADRSDLFEWLGAILGGTVAKYSVALLLAAVAVYSLQARVPRRRRSSTPHGSQK
jgi:di/tricarboxylate transporter